MPVNKGRHHICTWGSRVDVDPAGLRQVELMGEPVFHLPPSPLRRQALHIHPAMAEPFHLSELCVQQKGCDKRKIVFLVCSNVLKVLFVMFVLNFAVLPREPE